jgi:hypothetical protein
MIQQMGGSRPDAMNFRADSAKLVYDALKPAAPPRQRPRPKLQKNRTRALERATLKRRCR